MSPGRAAPGAVWVLVLAAVLAAALSGCGREPEPLDLEEAPVDTLAELAERVEQAFQESDTSPDGREAGRQRAFAAAVALTRSVMAGERPRGGWRRESLAAALRARGLSIELRELEGRDTPSLLLVSDPRNPAAPGRALLVYPDEADQVPLPLEPFRHEFHTASWNDSLGPVFAVAGWRRTVSGGQPTVWLFPVPDGSAGDAEPDPLGALAVHTLAEAGGGELSFLGHDGGGAPLLRVRGAALPNPLFEECSNCPHLEADLVYRFQAGAWRLIRQDDRRTPYAAFVEFVTALLSRNDERARQFAANPEVLEQARALGFDASPQRGRWRIAPGSSAASLDQVYLRGNDGAFRVLWSVRDTSFVVTSIAPTDFVVD